MNFNKAIASAEITIINETDASTLTANMQVIKGSRNQIFLTGQENPFSPDWTKNNLVLRPFLQASNVTNTDLNGAQYNPDLFDPKEYGKQIYEEPYIKDIHWFIRDTAGIETEIYESEDFAFSYTYSIDTESGSKNVLCNDKRQLVVKGNILEKNSTTDIICKFSFYDPYANIHISQQVSISLVNIASGVSNSKLTTMPINGNTITNTGIQYLDVVAKFYGESGEESIADLIDDGDGNTSCLWYIRDNDNWVLLNPTAEGQQEANSSTMLYEIKRITAYDANTGNYTFENYCGAKGNAVLRIYPNLINGSEVVKCVFTDFTGAQYSAIEVLYDNTDTTKVEIYATNGTRLRKATNNYNTESTDLKAIVTYKGNLLSDNSPLYDTEFDYYWYKYTFKTGEIVNVYNNGANELIENKDSNNLIKGKRILHVTNNDIDLDDKKNRIMLDIAEHTEEMAIQAQSLFYDNSITEEDLNIARIMNVNAGLEENDMDNALITAKELNAITDN